MIKSGEKLFQYTIISAIGSGGMGEVFVAEDNKLGRRAALKFLSKDLAADSGHVERFLREARAASALNHPNICTVYEINDTSHPPFIAMEYVEGETVAELIRRRRRPSRQVVDIALQVAEALAEAHEKGIIHRDIKPANIIVNKHGRVKVLDFGLAKWIMPDETNSGTQFQTNAGVVLGTASYMSPEQARGLDVDGRTDIWSLGVSIYEMLTGSLPFKGATVADTLALILTATPPAPSAAASDVMPELDRLVLRSISRSRDERFQDLREVAAELRKLQKMLESGEGTFDRPGIHGFDGPTEAFDLAPTVEIDPFDTDLEAAVRKTAPTNLTAVRERIIGRETELASLSRLLLDPEVRLITMTGIGGTGKTTLSRAAAREMLNDFPDGVFFIELADVSRPESVASAIAKPLGVKDEGQRPILEILADRLSERTMLLVIDNFEQVVEAAPQLSQLLAAAPGVKMLVTSREVLRLSSEIEFRVPPLSLPPDSATASFDDISSNDAVRLFIERAGAARHGFELSSDNIDSIARLCSRLEGLPLAIELAAARTRILSPKAILARLEDSLNLLTGGSRDRPERQQTMRGAVMWSYGLLNGTEKQAFRQLAVFSGGFRLEAAESVCSGNSDFLDTLSSLIDKSLLVRKETADGEFRFKMLDVVREFAGEMLHSEGEAFDSRGRHAEYFTQFAEAAEPSLQGASSGIWLVKLADEHNNLRAAMEWGLAHAPETAIRLAVAARNYWLVQSHLTEGFGWLKAALDTGIDPPGTLKFKLLNGLGLAARFCGDLDTARRAYETGLTAGTEAGDMPGTAISNRGLGLVAMQQGDLMAAGIYFNAGLDISRELGDKYGIAMSLSFLGDLARTEGRYAEARPIFEEAVGLFRELENKAATNDSLNNLGAALVCLDEPVKAAQNFSEALSGAGQLSNRITISIALDGFAALAAGFGDPDEAAVLAGAAEKLRESVNYRIEPAEAKFRGDYLARLGDRISPADLKRLYESGRQLSLDDAVLRADAITDSLTRIEGTRKSSQLSGQ